MVQTDRTELARRVVAVLGLAMIWPLVHNQIMYPLTFTFVKEGGPSPFLLYLVYAAVFCVACCACFFRCKEITERFLMRAPVALGYGLICSAGTVLIAFCDFSSPVSSAALFAGVLLAAMATPMLFAFWGIYLVSYNDGTREGGVRIAIDVVASYIVFCLITALRLTLGLHASAFGIAYPFISGVLAFMAVRTGMNPVPQGSASVAQLPRNVTVCSLLFVYLSTFVVTFLNPIDASVTYPPNRALLYVAAALMMGAVGFVYLRNSRAVRKAETWSFAVLSVTLVGAILLTALGTASSIGLGNFPTIAGRISFEVFLFILVVAGSHNRHVNPTRLVMLFLIAAVTVPNVLSAWATHTGAFSLGDMGVAGLVVTVVVAFAVSGMANLTLVLFVAKRGSKAKTQEDEDAQAPVKQLEPFDYAQEKVRAAWGLSEREVDIARLACRRLSAAEIADKLCIAESTVYTHLKRIYRKAGVHSRQELVELVETFHK